MKCCNCDNEAIGVVGSQLGPYSDSVCQSCLDKGFDPLTPIILNPDFTDWMRKIKMSEEYIRETIAKAMILNAKYLRSNS